MVMEAVLDIVDHPVQAPVAEAMAVAMAMAMAMATVVRHQETKPMHMGMEGAPKRGAITMANVGEEASTMTRILVEEERAKTHIRMVVARSATAITKAKGRVTVSEVEVTTTRATVGDGNSDGARVMRRSHGQGRMLQACG